MIAQLVEADPGSFEVVVLIALAAGVLGLGLTVAKHSAAAIVNVLAVVVFISSFLFLT